MLTAQADTFSYTRSIQQFTAPTAGEYDIVAFGASGGSGSIGTGGLGAEMGGDFNLTAGETLDMGQAGLTAHAGGGGGGRFVVVDSTTTPLVIAGGGGGGGADLKSQGGQTVSINAGQGGPGQDGNGGGGFNAPVNGGNGFTGTGAAASRPHEWQRRGCLHSE